MLLLYRNMYRSPSMHIESDNTIEYIGIDYTVCGKVITMGQNKIGIQDIHSISLCITDGFTCPNEQTSDYFTVSVMTTIELPWVLDEPFPGPIEISEPIQTKEKKGFFHKLFKA